MTGADLLEVHDAVGRVIAKLVTRRCPAAAREDLAQHLRLFLVTRGDALLARFRHDAALETYLTAALERRAMSWLRDRDRSARHEVAIEPTDGDPALPGLPSALDALVDAEAAGQRRRAGRAALNALDPRDRRFVLRWVLGSHSMDHVAHAFGLTPAAAYSRWYRLRRQLRGLMAVELQSDPIRSDPIGRTREVTAGRYLWLWSSRFSRSAR